MNYSILVPYRGVVTPHVFFTGITGGSRAVRLPLSIGILRNINCLDRARNHPKKLKNQYLFVVLLDTYSIPFWPTFLK